MSNQASEILQDAFELIENNKLEEARKLIEPLLESDASNPNVWWIYAHAVEDSDEGMQAIEKVLELDSTYPGASSLKTEITQSRVPDGAIDDFDDLDFMSEDNAQSYESPKKRGGIPRLAIIAVIVLLVVVVGLFLVLFGSSNPQPTQVANNPTEAPTVDAQIITNPTATDSDNNNAVEATNTVETSNTAVPEETEPPSLPEETEEPLNHSAIVDALVDQNVTTDDVAIVTTSIGETLTVTICSPLGIQSSATLNTVMNVFVEQESTLSDTVEAVGVVVVDCDSESPSSRIIGVPVDIVRSLANGEIESKDFQRAWQPLHN